MKRVALSGLHGETVYIVDRTRVMEASPPEPVRKACIGLMFSVLNKQFSERRWAAAGVADLRGRSCSACENGSEAKSPSKKNDAGRS